jgi:hypothetical protein
MSTRSSLAAAVMAAALPLVALPADAAAQESMDRGTRVRVIRKGGQDSVTGRLVARGADLLAVETGKGVGVVRIPYGQVARLQVSEGRHRAKGAGVGALLGLVAAGAVYVIAPRDCTGSDCAERFGLIAAPSIAAGALLGTFSAPEHWRTVDRVPDVTLFERSRLQLAIGPPRGGGIRATVVLAF